MPIATNTRYLRNLTVRTQLMLVFAFLTVTTTAISTMTLTTMFRHLARTALQERSTRIAERLQLQLRTVIAQHDRPAARELLDAYASDRDVDGIGVYSEDGELIAGRGLRPERLPPGNADPIADAHHLLAVAPVLDFKSPPGRQGRLYLSFSTLPSEELGRQYVWMAVVIGAGAVLFALFLAAHLSRRITLRLVRITAAASRMAGGDPSHARVDDLAKDEIGALAQAFNRMVMELNRVSAEHAQLVSTEHERLEDLVSDRTRALEQSREMFRLVAESTNAIPFTLDLTSGAFPYIGALAMVDSGIPEATWRQPGALDVFLPRETNQEVRQCFEECGNGPFEFVTAVSLRDGRHAEMRWTGTCECESGSKILRGLMLDITEFRRMGRERAAAQKLESVGRLAAGVAHEINTPVQFVSDNAQFLRSSIADFAVVIDAYRNLLNVAQSSGDLPAAVQRAVEAEKSIDLDFIMENAPIAIDSSIEGLGNIATIVRSMKEFAHPDQAQKTIADLNQAIRSTLVIARNEYRYVAEVDVEFGDVPPVECHLGEINQVLLNLIVNAAHAIEDVVKDTATLGKITIRTRLDDTQVEISIGDTGTGIPESARDKIFDPFFTTKEVGKGTGQGLAIAHSVIVKKHGGTLRFATESGVGTTFFVRLPIQAPEHAESLQKVAA